MVGKHTIGVYPLLDDDGCYFLTVDFDEADWRDLMPNAPRVLLGTGKLVGEGFDHPALLRMWEKRRRGYVAMGYRVRLEPQP